MRACRGAAAASVASAEHSFALFFLLFRAAAHTCIANICKSSAIVGRNLVLGSRVAHLAEVLLLVAWHACQVTP